MIFDKVHLLFRIRIWIHNLKLRIRILILQKVSDPYGSGSTTLQEPIKNYRCCYLSISCRAWPTAEDGVRDGGQLVRDPVVHPGAGGGASVRANHHTVRICQRYQRRASADLNEIHLKIIMLFLQQEHYI
jgi:hypothetical protein